MIPESIRVRLEAYGQAMRVWGEAMDVRALDEGMAAGQEALQALHAELEAWICPTHGVLREVEQERVQQDAREEQRDFPMVPEGMPPGARHRWYGVPQVAYAQEICEIRFRTGHGTYADLAIQEVCAALEAPPEAMRAALIRCAAVFVAMVEAMDRRPPSP